MPQETAFALYDPAAETKLSADASAYGLGAVLLQKFQEDWKPVAYASCSLSETEQQVIVCGDTEVPLEQLEEYVADILSVAHEVSDSTNIELQFKVSGSGRGGREVWLDLLPLSQRLAVDKSDTYRFASANKDVNKAKNRYVNVLPCESLPAWPWLVM